MFVATEGEKLQWLRTSMRPKLSQGRFGKLITLRDGSHATRDMVAAWENDRSAIPPEAAEEVVNMFPEETGKDPRWLFDGKDLPEPEYKPAIKRANEVSLENVAPYPLIPGADPPNPLGLSGMVEAAGRRLFPVLGTAAAAAAPTFSVANVDDFIDFSDELYRPERFAIRVKGRSMEKPIIENDYLLVQPATFLYNSMLAVISNGEGEFAVKNYITKGGRPLLVPENPEYEPLVPGEGWEIVGYAVGWKRVFGKGSYAEIGHDKGIKIIEKLHIVPFAT